MSQAKLKCGILGVTGTVGQRFVQLLADHPWFEIGAIGASERSAGKKYGEVVNWLMSSDVPKAIAEKVIVECTPANFKECSLVFSALDSSVAGTVEDEFSKAEIPVFSNSKNHRMDDDVPIVIPFVNPEHIDVIPAQRKNRGLKKGFIVTNANCTTTGLVVGLKPLQEAFGIKRMFVVTMQAISGAGYPGVSAYDITSNVVPYISGEEEKVAIEPLKILGSVVSPKEGTTSHFQDADFKVSAHCNRVPVLEGHTECVSVELEKPATPEEVAKVFKAFNSRSASFQLPSSPPMPIRVTENQTHPQPRLDLDNGYVTVIGRIRECSLFTVKFVLLSHNTVIGAAGGSILNAELAKVKGYLN